MNDDLQALADYLGEQIGEPCPVERAAARALAILRASQFEENQKAMRIIRDAAALVTAESNPIPK